MLSQEKRRGYVTVATQREVRRPVYPFDNRNYRTELGFLCRSLELGLWLLPAGGPTAERPASWYLLRRGYGQ
jgi:hypothetical protein